MTTTLFLYLLPLFGRFALLEVSQTAWYDVVLSLLPLLVVAPSSYLPKYIPNEETEHVVRHALYAVSFTVAAGTSVRWDAVVDRLDDDAVWAFVLYLIIGTLTLWWFCVSHLLENAQLCGRSALLYTHQGDVVVLPLTLVAIATFARDLPDDIFRFSRAVPFYVPIIVAWATMHFLAFTGFGRSQTTTHTHSHFKFYASAALVVASAHLFLLEMRAPATVFQAFPPIAALLSQFTYRAERPPQVRPDRAMGTVVAGTGLAIAFGFLLWTRWSIWLSFGIPWVAILGCAFALPPLAGRKWYVPGVGYATLLSSLLLHRLEPETPLRPQDVGLFVGGYMLTLFALAKIAPATWQFRPPHARPPTNVHARPQETLSACSFSKLSQSIDRACPLPSSSKYAMPRTTWLESPLGGSKDPECPPSLKGLWWMEGNIFAQELLCIENPGIVQWNTQGKTTKGRWFPQRRGITRSGSIGGLLGLLGGFFVYTDIEFLVDEDTRRPTGWIRTQVSILPGLKWFSSTFWLYAIHPDEMVRIVYDEEGKVTWQYRMLRIAHDPHRVTQFYNAFVDAHGGQNYWVWW